MNDPVQIEIPEIAVRLENVARVPSSVVHTKIDQLERAMADLPSADIRIRHIFAPGVYAREATIPAGTLLVGKIHKTRHISIVSEGEITVWAEGEGEKRIKAPFTLVAEPGTRRVGFAHTDTVWTAIHGTHETDLEKLEEELIEPRQLGGPPNTPELPK